MRIEKGSDGRRRVARPSALAIHAGAGLLVVTAIAAGCSGGPDSSGTAESVASTAEALTAAISGTITDPSGRPLAGVTVTLNGAEQLTETTGADGQYSFDVNVSGATASFSVQPGRSGCSFNPSVTNLNGVSGNRSANFSGSGATCVGVAVDAGQSVATDPGPRGGAAGAGAPITPQPINPDSASAQAAAAVACLSRTSNTTPAPGLSAALLAACEQAIIRFQEVDSVSGTVGTESGVGLGPTFNGNSCSMCHAQPGVMGSSPGMNSPQHPIPNPQIALATLDGATNAVPPFITAGGPVREVRFPTVLATGAGDGGVHGLFTIAGRVDAQGCAATQPNFAAQIAANDIIFRIPTPTFGTGLIENVLETSLEANLNAAPAGAPASASLGISGVLNRSGNDGSITRFGWKAQNKSLTIFSGEAYNVEQGVSNLNFPNEREGGAGNLNGCFAINPTPEDNSDFSAAGTLSDNSSDLFNFALAMQLSAPPSPAAGAFTIGTTAIAAAQVTTGQSEFIAIGCGNCHTPTLKTGPSSFDAALSNVTFHPYSDIAIHHMGTGLSDNVSQGGATGDEFRSAPLWGVGQRLFFLHDGRTSNLVTAIEEHASSGSEANAVVANFNALSAANQQAIVDFLRSL